MSVSSANRGLKPGVCTSSTRPSNPFTGQIVFETDTGFLRVWDGSAWDYLSQSQDTTTNIKASDIGGAWSAWTPTITQSNNITYTAQYAKYGQINKFVFAECRVDLTNSGTAGNQISVTTPVSIAGAGQCIGTAFFYDASANNTYNLTCLRLSSTALIFFYNLTGASSDFGVTPSLALGSSDQIRISIFFEAA